MEFNVNEAKLIIRQFGEHAVGNCPFIIEEQIRVDALQWRVPRIRGHGAWRCIRRFTITVSGGATKGRS